ncbi:MAG: alanine--tRNA ligase [Lachnospiraceae bacterium]|uniref:Alanine--tRNA ligase n=1 Tax=Hominisplanchenecus murintestinalis TaxID=2941517 RepID=A0AC61QWY5_9FIRM|nr:alanine--tRNA ligase [Hominisplanchenecus murintestinalis]MCI9516499.1 alanine--tRNA ligase [Lachnospiraceae bacterium]RKJ95324.1 alanine--tRNA ligase [Anaerotruncus sp. 1XD22-93]MCI9660978.1 alanine--tRNA ligase [Lachnospiraceae bacterium]NBH97776.1 alanine--tRNA ligase [Lachnospiraceae bacterium]NBI74908.1 alanine--tRNA ligase [Lachnospiraceae bacterium]
MKKYGVNELRRMFLEFFESKGHLAMKSFSLVPHNDKSLLLINSGMAPLKPYFTGAEIPPRRRVTTCQKCIRTGDIENVGKTARHGTFFEMLGNFSFGDYFKTEAISWTWEFLTEVVGLDADRLYPSIYEEDEEAFEIWNKKIGIAPERIFRFGKGDNFWEHGSGPCGPCSEVYYDRGEKYGCGSPDCTVGCECDRYMEVWNNVFTQFDNDGNGNYTELEQKNIDTGMGLERLAVVVQDVDSIFDVDTIEALRNKVCEYAHVTYKENEEKDVSIRLITDHIRSATFMISDGIMPTNEGRGYVLRRLIRRAARHGRLLGIQGGFLSGLSETVIAGSKDGYPELEEKKEFILKVLAQEEEKFNKTIDQGLSILAGMEADMEKAGKKELDGKDAFILYDTYGFPLDLTKEILEEKGYSIDESGFKAAMEEQRKKARSARATTNYMGKDATVYDEIDVSVTTEFVGYDRLSHESKITVLTTEKEITEALSDGDKGTVLVEQTPFYATMGGQEGDTGVIRTTEGEFRVESTIKLMGGKVGHVGYMTKGMLKAGDTAVLEVNAAGRNATCKNHSATHLLQKALKTVLGSHVEQKGSLVTPNRLRFDFAHFAPMTQEEIAKAEELVNREIQASLPVVTEIMNVEDAKKSGAMALFGEKYEDEVRVVSMGDFSRELCGGTHVANTGTITVFKIVSESGIAAGVRRIEALTGDGVFVYYKEAEQKLAQAAALLKTTPNELADKISHLQAELKAAQSENESLKSKLAQDALGDVMNQVQEVKGVKLLAASLEDVDMNGLRDLGDQLKEKLGEGVVVLASAKGGKVSLLAMATDAAQKAGAHAGNLIKGMAAIVGGGGGGRPNMAQAGGKNPEKIGEALEAAAEILMGQIK